MDKEYTNEELDRAFMERERAEKLQYDKEEHFDLDIVDRNTWIIRRRTI